VNISNYRVINIVLIFFLIGYILPLFLYHINFLQFGFFVDTYFEFIHKDHSFNFVDSNLKYLFVCLAAVLGIYSVSFYKIREPYRISRIKVLKERSLVYIDYLILVMLSVTGFIRIYYTIGHSQFQSTLQYSGVIHYFSTSFLYLIFLYRCVYNLKKIYFFLGASIIFITESLLLWRGFALTLAILFILIFWKSISKSLLLILFVLLFILYSALSNFRNTSVNSDSSVSSGISTITTVLNRFQGFTRAFIVVNSDMRYDFSNNDAAIRQIDTIIWGLNPDIKNSIGGASLGLSFFYGGIISVFFYFHLVTLMFIILNSFSKNSIVFKSIFYFVFAQINIILIEGVSLIYFFVLLLSCFFLFSFHAFFSKRRILNL